MNITQVRENRNRKGPYQLTVKRSSERLKTHSESSTCDKRNVSASNGIKRHCNNGPNCLNYQVLSFLYVPIIFLVTAILFFILYFWDICTSVLPFSHKIAQVNHAGTNE